MRVLLYWIPRHRADLENTVALLGAAFAMTLDVLATPLDAQTLALPGIQPAQMRHLPASGALEVDVTRACATQAYDLVITPPAERPGLLRMLFGSHIGRLMHQAPATIWVARRVTVPIRRIVVGVSGGPQTEHDVALATLLAQAFGAHLTLVHVLSQVPLLYTGIWNPAQLTADERLARVEPGVAYLRQVSARLETAGVAHTLVVREGLVQDELLGVLDGDQGQPRGDLMVIGAHARSSAAGMDYYEDIAGQVTRAAPVSTLVVHAESDWSHWAAARTPLGAPAGGTAPAAPERRDAANNA